MILLPIAGLTPKHIKATEISKIQIAANPSALTKPLKKGIAKLPILKQEELKINIALSLFQLLNTAVTASINCSFGSCGNSTPDNSL